MEIEEMKSLWQDLGEQHNSQKKLTKQIIMDMTQEKYNDKFKTILTLESMGAIVCLLFFLLIAVNFGKLDTWYLMLCGMICATFYLFFPIISLRSILKLKRINLAQNNYKDTIIKYTVRRRQFLKIQRVGLGLCFVMLISCLPVTCKIFGGKDIFLDRDIWLWYLPIGIVGLALFARWGYQSYQSITYKAEIILQEINS